MENKNGKYKNVASRGLLICMVVTNIFTCTTFIWFICLPNMINKLNESPWLWCGFVLMLLVLPLVALAFSARRFMSVIEINDKGVSRALFKKFYKQSMKWEEIAEVSYYESLFPYLMFSKTKSIQGLSYNEIAKMKDCVQIRLTPKCYDVVKQYVRSPIRGLTDEKITKLKLNK